jgi:hypothetical protein
MALQSCLLDRGLFFRFLIIYTESRTPWTGDQPVARPLLTHRINADIHVSSKIWIHYPSVRASEDSSCLRPHGHCDRHLLQYCLTSSKYEIVLHIIASVIYFPYHLMFPWWRTIPSFGVSACCEGWPSCCSVLLDAAWIQVTPHYIGSEATGGTAVRFLYNSAINQTLLLTPWVIKNNLLSYWFISV